jgi:F-type H+-transporting ATPase subunit alpha
MLIYAGTRGFLDGIPIARIKDWQPAFVRFVKTQYAQVGQTILSKLDLPADTENTLKQAFDEFNKSWS